MEEAQRRALRRGRARLVAALRVSPLWDPLEERGLFTRPMVEELQSAGSRGEQARQLVIDLETRGKQAFPIFLSILRDTGQGDLADMLIEECECLPAPPQLVDLRPVELDLRGEKHNKNVNFPERLSIPVQVESERPRTPPAPAQGVRAESRPMRTLPDPQQRQLQYRLKSVASSRLRRGLREAGEALQGLGLQRPDWAGSQSSGNDFRAEEAGAAGPRGLGLLHRGDPFPWLSEQKDRGFVVDCDSPSDEAPGGSLESDATPFQTPAGDVDEPDAVASLPTPSDILVCYSTFPGFVSWREVSSGSWYVNMLDSVLEQYAHSEDLLTMLVRVGNAVSTKGRYKQMPGCFNFLRKKFFFKCK
ncbi:caspase-9 isoform 2-T2 [Theristicus caerulescens]